MREGRATGREVGGGDESGWWAAQAAESILPLGQACEAKWKASLPGCLRSAEEETSGSQRSDPFLAGGAPGPGGAGTGRGGLGAGWGAGKGA